MKYNPNKGYTNDWMDFNQDGALCKRRIKGKDKKYMQRLTKHRLKMKEKEAYKLYFDEAYKYNLYEEGDE